MNIEGFKIIIESEIEAAKKYEEFVENTLMPILSATNAEKIYEYLRGFNIGYKYAMEKVLALLEYNEPKETNKYKLCPKCQVLRVTEGYCWNKACDYKEPVE